MFLLTLDLGQNLDTPLLSLVKVTLMLDLFQLISIRICHAISFKATFSIACGFKKIALGSTMFLILMSLLYVVVP